MFSYAHSNTEPINNVPASFLQYPDITLKSQHLKSGNCGIYKQWKNMQLQEKNKQFTAT